jgi:Tfp pilus assembly protein PilF
VSEWRPAAAFACAALLLAACSSEPAQQVEASFRSMKESIQSSLGVGNKGAPDLAAGIREYDDGNYPASAKSLQRALDLGLSASADRIKAHKYLAFIDCTSGREQKCRDEFRAALQIDPNMELAPAEAGHPIWGPVFRSVKAQFRRKAGNGS